MGIEQTIESPLATAIRVTGSQSAFARLLGRGQATVNDWLRLGKPLPAEHVLAVEAATGVSRHDLRPDLYPLERQGGLTPPSPDRLTVGEGAPTVSCDRSAILQVEPAP